LKTTSEEDSSARSERIRELEAAVKTSEEALEHANKRWEKDNAIYKQKQEFLEVSL